MGGRNGFRNTVSQRQKAWRTIEKNKERGYIDCVGDLSFGKKIDGSNEYTECMYVENVILLTVKEKYELGNNIQSQILAFAFSLSAQIERDLISQRTREGLARRIASGQKLGRPMGGHNSKYKLTGKKKN